MRYLSITSITLLLLSCNPTNTRDEALGRYANSSEPDADHFVDLYTDSSFVHIYENKHGRQINKGNWQLSSNGHDVMFENWVSFGEDRDGYCIKGCDPSVQLHGGELLFDYDRPEVNFIKR